MTVLFFCEVCGGGVDAATASKADGQRAERDDFRCSDCATDAAAPLDEACPCDCAYHDDKGDCLCRAVTRAKAAPAPSLDEAAIRARDDEQCPACTDGHANTEDHACSLGDNGGWGPAGQEGNTLEAAILAELRDQPEAMLQALQAAHDRSERELQDALAAERALRVEKERALSLARDALRAIEWNDLTPWCLDGGPVEYCPYCQISKRAGHASDCKVAIALREQPAAEGEP